MLKFSVIHLLVLIGVCQWFQVNPKRKDRSAYAIASAPAQSFQAKCRKEFTATLYLPVFTCLSSAFPLRVFQQR
jgi:hypothetical protein